MTATQTHQIKFVSSTELFKGLPSDLVHEMWNTCPFSFGDCSFSLIHPNWVKGWILDIFDDEENEQVNKFFIQLSELEKDGVYIDIEG